MDIIPTRLPIAYRQASGRTKRILVKNARFWIWYNDSPVKITLAPTERLDLHDGGPTDEGYSYTHYSYLHAGDCVESSIETVAQDCDGRFDSYREYECLLIDLQVNYNEYADCMMPTWNKKRAYQRDHSAEAMGY